MHLYIAFCNLEFAEESWKVQNDLERLIPENSKWFLRFTTPEFRVKT